MTIDNNIFLFTYVTTVEQIDLILILSFSGTVIFRNIETTAAVVYLINVPILKKISHVSIL